MDGHREGVRQELLEDHRRMEELAARVAAHVDANDPHGALAAWPEFERALLTHMEAEEMHVLPRLAEVDVQEARGLRDEHAVLRAELGELNIALELHFARKHMFDALVARLRKHAVREEALMYDWAERALPERVVGAVRRMLRR
jgi:hypothetical protein